jgi:dUTP pyrophosphatase
MKIQVQKLHPEAYLPEQASEGAAGFDLVAMSVDGLVMSDKYLYTYRTGLAVAIPEGYVGLLFPRSSVSKTGASLANCVGVLDPDYRGEVMLKFYHTDEAPYPARCRVGQLVVVPAPKVEFVEVSQLDTTVRDTGGFGSTDTL